MKITRSSKIQSLILAAALSIGLGFVSPVSAQERAFILDLNSKGLTKLGTLGGNFSEAYGINDAGQVVGISDTAAGVRHAFITGPDGLGMTDLGTLLAGNRSGALGINDAGQVVGWSHISQTALDGYHAFITGPNGVGMTDLGSIGKSLYDLNDVPFYSVATGINDAGQVVGYSTTPTTGLNAHAFITGPDSVMTDLGILGGRNSYARDINDAGQVVGISDTATAGVRHAFITGPNGTGMTDLGTLGGNNSEAYGINAAGQVVGISDTATAGVRHAFITGPNGAGMTDLGTLGGNNSEAYGINAAGQVVGSSETAAGDDWHALITGPDGVGMTDLNSLVKLPAGSVIASADDINNTGQVVFTIIPEPQSYALMLAGLILLGFMARRKSLLA